MELKIDIEGMVSSAIQANLSPEKLQPIINENVGKAIKSAIESQFHYNSPFKAAIEKAMTERMPATVADMGLYGDFIMKAVVTKLNDLQMEQATNAITPMIERLTKPLPSAITITVLLQEVFDDFNDHTEDYRESNDCPTFIVRQSYPDSSVLRGHMDVFIDPEEGKTGSNCKFKLHFDNDGKCTGVEIDEEDMKSKLILGHRRYGVERLLMQLYTQQVTVTFDKTDFDGKFEYSHPNDD